MEELNKDIKFNKAIDILYNLSNLWTTSKEQKEALMLGISCIEEIMSISEFYKGNL